MPFMNSSIQNKTREEASTEMKAEKLSSALASNCCISEDEYNQGKSVFTLDFFFFQTTILQDSSSQRFWSQDTFKNHRGL